MARGLYVVNQLPPIDVVSRPAVASFAAAQDIYGAPQKMLPKALMDVGLTLELAAHGEFSLVSSATASCGFGIGCAPLAAPTTGQAILAQSQLLTPGAATITSGHWQAYYMGKLKTIGTGTAGGTFKGRGWVRLASSATPFNTDVNWPIPVTLLLATVTFDCTADRPLNVIWQWGTSAAGNTVTVDDFIAKLAS